MEPGDVVFRHACKLGFEGIVSKRLGSPYISGRSRTWLKFKNPAAPAVKRRRIGGADCSRRRVQCGLTQNFDIALTVFRKLDDRSGDQTPNLNYCLRQFASRTRNCAPSIMLWGGCGVFPTLCTSSSASTWSSSPGWPGWPGWPCEMSPSGNRV